MKLLMIIVGFVSCFALENLDDLALRTFRDYLRIRTAHPNPDYGASMSFLQRKAKDLNLTARTLDLHPGIPILLFTELGEDASLPSILLNSHMDVVPVEEEFWQYPPFAAHMDEKGNIHGRGSQDMKSAGSQYLEAVRRLKLKGRKLKRTLHILYVPDEEIGGPYGMRNLAASVEFKKLNVGFAIDEGITNPGDEFIVFYGERMRLQIWITCVGRGGHTLSLENDTAAEKLRYIINKFMDFRDSEKQRLKNPGTGIANVTSINLTQLKGGVHPNMLPSKLQACFDVRLDNEKDPQEFEDMVREWCQEAGNGVTYDLVKEAEMNFKTSLDDGNPYWGAMLQAAKKLNFRIRREINPATADIKFMRMAGVPGIGFSPLNGTKLLAHDHNEYLNKDVFLRGVKVYEEVIAALGNI